MGHSVSTLQRKRGEERTEDLVQEYRRGKKDIEEDADKVNGNEETRMNIKWMTVKIEKILTHNITPFATSPASRPLHHPATKTVYEYYCSNENKGT